MPQWITSPARGAVVAELIGLRTAAGLTQRSLASRMGLGYTLIAKVESGQRNVSLVEFLDWCRATDANPSEVIARLNTEASRRAE